MLTETWGLTRVSERAPAGVEGAGVCAACAGFAGVTLTEDAGVELIGWVGTGGIGGGVVGIGPASPLGGAGVGSAAAGVGAAGAGAAAGLAAGAPPAGETKNKSIKLRTGPVSKRILWTIIDVTQCWLNS